MNLDRSIPGRVYVAFGADGGLRGGARGCLSRDSTFNAEGQPDGAGVNVSAFGTLRASELRDLGRLLIEEADALEKYELDCRVHADLFELRADWRGDDVRETS